MTLTGVDDHSKWRAALEGVCEGAFERVAVENIEQNGSWDRFAEASIDVEEYFQGGTVLNNELGNLYQKTSEFERHGGSDRYYYVGEDPRKNDYFPTTEESYQGSVAIKDFYTQAESKFLAPPGAFNAGSCDKTAAAMCCWSGDRQYNDNNGRCSLGHCINQAPGDNTDLCWVEEDDGSIFPYPNPTEDNQRERDLHCKKTFEFFSILLRHYSRTNPFLYREMIRSTNNYYTYTNTTLFSILFQKVTARRGLRSTAISRIRWMPMLWSIANQNGTICILFLCTIICTSVDTSIPSPTLPILWVRIRCAVAWKI